MTESQRKRKLDELVLNDLNNLKEQAKLIKTKVIRSDSGKFRCTYSEEFKSKAIQLCAIKGVSIVSTQLGIGESILFRWCKSGAQKKRQTRKKALLSRT